MFETGGPDFCYPLRVSPPEENRIACAFADGQGRRTTQQTRSQDSNAAKLSHTGIEKTNTRAF